MGYKICVENGRFLYFNDGGKLEIYYIQKRYPVLKNDHQLFSFNVLN